MKNKWIALGVSLLTAFSLTSGRMMPSYFSHSSVSKVYAADDAIGLTFKKEGDNLKIKADGTLGDSSWYYKQVEVPVKYSDGQSGTLRLSISGGNKTISATYNWSNNQDGKVTDTDDQKKSFTAEVSMPLSAFHSSSFTLDYQGKKTAIGDQKDTDSSDKDEKPAKISLTPNVGGLITVDGKLSDWSNKVTSRSSDDSDIRYWKAVRDQDGNLYFCFTGTADTQWYDKYKWKVLDLKQNGSTESIQINDLASKENANVKIVNQANHNTAGDYVVEVKIPSSALKDPDFSLKFAGSTVDAKDLQVIDGKDVTPKDDGKYHGIVIDGSFDDWNHVTKYDAKNPNKQDPDCLKQAAMVFDGDYVYLYVKEGDNETAAHAGTHANGNFAITTDLGRTKLLHFRDDGTVTSGNIRNIKARHVGDQWEVSFPKSELPNYQKTISFGLYMNEPFVRNVSNMKGGSGNAGSFNGITYDGHYEDWDSYPHTLIEYDTPGTASEMPDGEEAIYEHDGKIYGHVFTELADHLSEHGGEFAQDVSIRINRDDKLMFYPRLVSVTDGHINWNPTFDHDGTYEYYLVDNQGWSNATTLDELNNSGHNHVYGKMTMTIKNGLKDECEYYIDEAQLAKKLNLQEKDMTYVEAQFGRIGKEWVGTTGASTNPFLGVAICVAVVIIVLLGRKYKSRS